MPIGSLGALILFRVFRASSLFRDSKATSQLQKHTFPNCSYSGYSFWRGRKTPHPKPVFLPLQTSPSFPIWGHFACPHTPSAPTLNTLIKLIASTKHFICIRKVELFCISRVGTHFMFSLEIGCPQHLRKPKSNLDYWNRKIARNVERDAKTNAAYKAYKRSDWKLMRFWEHELKDDLDGCVRKIEKAVRLKLRFLIPKDGKL